MPVSTGPVGPFPPGSDPEEYDKLRRRVLWTMPSGLYVVGSRGGDRRNAMTLNLATQVGTDPKLLAIAVVKDALTHSLIAESSAFSLNILDREDRAIVRKFVKPVEMEPSPEGDPTRYLLNGFAFRDGRTGVPVLDQAVAYFECAVRNAVDCGDHTLFIGEIVDAVFQKAEDTPVLRMEDTRMNYGG